jgi:hypothetical protein
MFEYHMFYVLYRFVTSLLTVPRVLMGTVGVICHTVVTYMK